jgi:hypothetical protein
LNNDPLPSPRRRPGSSCDGSTSCRLVTGFRLPVFAGTGFAGMTTEADAAVGPKCRWHYTLSLRGGSRDGAAMLAEGESGARSQFIRGTRRDHSTTDGATDVWDH